MVLEQQRVGIFRNPIVLLQALAFSLVEGRFLAELLGALLVRADDVERLLALGKLLLFDQPFRRRQVFLARMPVALSLLQAVAPQHHLVARPGLGKWLGVRLV